MSDGVVPVAGLTGVVAAANVTGVVLLLWK